jgi:hypothetical protein
VQYSIRSYRRLTGADGKGRAPDTYVAACLSPSASTRGAFDDYLARSELVCGVIVEDVRGHRRQPSEVGFGSRSLACAVQLGQVSLLPVESAPRSERRRSKNSRVERPDKVRIPAGLASAVSRAR